MREFWVNFGIWVRWGLELIALVVIAFFLYGANREAAEANRHSAANNQLLNSRTPQIEQIVEQVRNARGDHKAILEKCER